MDAFARKLIENGQTTVANYLLSNFTRIGMSPDEFVMFLQIKRYSDEGVQFPDINKITDSTGYSKDQAYEILHQMIKKKLMTIQSTHDQNHNRCDKYDFSLMEQKLDQLSHSDHDNNDNSQLNSVERSVRNGITVSTRSAVFKQIAQEFGRQLSPMEISTVSHWLEVDQFKPKMISLALREAVLSQIFNLRYIEKILMSWKSRGLNTPQRLQSFKNRQNKFYHNHKNDEDDGKQGPDIPIFKL